ncbi:MAG: glycosyltransferase [Mesorhizobium sp.]|nr:glycosyltransferase [Mesorhizobium sp. M7A.F.Ca.MR.362.00.0.0]RUV21047.1 glycosyltransferase [Mesorhizobium sp. M7A.F.Ca.MR.245.00.0.0]RUV51196.1 glycosyltransferase [Mesorhizobium sp. M7A.F.Ca.MR.228.00.0.0]RWN96437.1 MAG: glycosyltransferase [Mesorhizobium sp.]
MNRKKGGSRKRRRRYATKSTGDRGPVDDDQAHRRGPLIRGPQVSLVVPAYNAKDYIAETIESLLAQDYPNMDIIVVDDGSTDGTSDLVSNYGPKIKLHRQVNAGQSAAMTTGWAMSTGDILGYLSADDRLRPTAVRRCVEELSARTDVVLVYPDFDIIDEHSTLRSTLQPPEFSRRALYAHLHCLPGPGAFFRREAYERAGYWREDLRQIPDLDFFLRLALEGNFYHVPEVLAEFRMHSASTTYRAVPFERGEEPQRMIETFFRRKDLPDELRKWERETRANANLLSAAIHGRSGRVAVAVQRLLGAARHPRTLLSRKAVSHALLIARCAFAPVRIRERRNAANRD